MIQVCGYSDCEEVCHSLGDLAHRFAGKAVLVGGGCGFLGRNMVRIFAHLNERILDKPVRVTVVDDFIVPSALEFQPVEDANVRLVQHNLCVPFEPEQRFDYIINLAGIASPHYYREFPMETLEVTVFGTRNLLEIARQHKARFIFFSSSEIYGNPPPNCVPTDESYRGYVSCRGPRACYDESKRLGETLCYIYSTNGLAHTCTIRPFNVFGPGMLENDYRVLPNFAGKILRGEPIHIYGTGNQTRTFCYITDAVDGIFRVMLLGTDNEVYNIGQDKPEISMLGLVLSLEKVLNRRIDFKLVEYPSDYPPDEPTRRCPDISKARRELGYKPQVELADGLHRFFDWARVNYQLGAGTKRHRTKLRLSGSS